LVKVKLDVPPEPPAAAELGPTTPTASAAPTITILFNIGSSFPLERQV
jgi:hypothetical protein